MLKSNVRIFFCDPGSPPGWPVGRPGDLAVLAREASAIDVAPGLRGARAWREEDIELLGELAESIMTEVELRSALAEMARLSEERKLEAVRVELEAAHARVAEREQTARSRAEASEEQVRSLLETMPRLALHEFISAHERYSIDAAPRTSCTT